MSKEDLHRTTLRLPRKLHHRAKVLAAQRDESLEALVARALSQYLAWRPLVKGDVLTRGDRFRDSLGIEVAAERWAPDTHKGWEVKVTDG